MKSNISLFLFVLLICLLFCLLFVSDLFWIIGIGVINYLRKAMWCGSVSSVSKSTACLEETLGGEFSQEETVSVEFVGETVRCQSCEGHLLLAMKKYFFIFVRDEFVSNKIYLPR